MQCDIIDQAGAMDHVISLSHVTVRYTIADERPRTFQEYLVNLAKRQSYQKRDFLALHDITLNVRRGGSVGVIGVNGSGKSTLLKVIAGIIKPVAGTVNTRGKIAPLIELGGGFDGDLTGLENIYLNASILGMSRKKIDSRLDRIIEFSELRTFLHTPLRNYSSGMVARLAFSIAIEVEADILVVDEVLSVGDEAFRQKCQQRIDRILSRGLTFLFVSHSIGEVQRLCESALWLDKGEIVALGDSDIVSRKYLLHFDKTVFDDIPEGHPWKRQIDAMFLRGITSGYTVNGRRFYNPENKVSRAEFAVFLSKALGMKSSSVQRRVFSDVPETHWASRHIAWVFDQGVIDGVRSDTGSLFFNPDDYVTTDDLRVILSRIDSHKCGQVVPRGAHPVNRGEIAQVLCDFFELERAL